MTESEKNQEYQAAKGALKVQAKACKEVCKGDKPEIRMCINNFADSLIKDHDWTGTMYEVWLSNFAASLHP